MALLGFPVILFRVIVILFHYSVDLWNMTIHPLSQERQ